MIKPTQGDDRARPTLGQSLVVQPTLCQAAVVLHRPAHSQLKTLRILLLTHETELSKVSNTAGLAFAVLAELSAVWQSRVELRNAEFLSPELPSPELSSSELSSPELSSSELSSSERCNEAKNAQTLVLALEQVLWQRKASDEHRALLRLMAPTTTPRYLLFPTPQAAIIDLQDPAARLLPPLDLLETLDLDQNIRRTDTTHAHHTGPDTAPHSLNDDCVELIILDATWQRARKMYRQSPYLQQMATLQFSNAPASQFTRRRNQIDGGWCTAEMIAMVWQLAGASCAATALAARFEEFNQR